MKQTKRAFSVSIICLLLCFAMLIGTTYAWFTDSVTSGKNKIVAGNLDVELYHTNGKVSSEKVTDSTMLFDDVDLWEPGAICYETFEVKNVGNLAFKYKMVLADFAKNYLTISGTDYDLTQVLKVAVVDGGVDSIDRSSAQNLSFTAFKDFTLEEMNAISPGDSHKYTMVVYWEPTDNDNNYNVKNGLVVSDYADTQNNYLWVEFGVQLEAVQFAEESDSFDKFYDNVDLTIVPAAWSGESAEIAYNNGGTYTIVCNEEVKASVTVPEGAKDEDGNNLSTDDKLKLVVDNGANASIKVEDYNSVTTYDVSLVRVSDGKKVTSDEPMTVTLDIGFVDLVRFYHKGIEYENRKTSAYDIAEIGDFYYNEETGNVIFLTNNFSPFSAVYYLGGGLGSETHPYIVSNGEQWLGMCTMYSYDLDKYPGQYYIDDSYIKLTNDIDLSGIELPYSCSIYGLNLDGDGHIVSNADGVCLFDNHGSYLYYNNVFKNLTIKNCNVDRSLFGYGTSSYYASSVTFENIKINNCTANGGVMLFYCCAKDGNSVSFTGCEVTNTVVNGGSSMALGGYIGNSGIQTTIKNCKFGGNLSSTKEAVSGFIGQGIATIINSEITKDAVIRNTCNGGVVYAFASNVASDSTNNSFNGKVYSTDISKVSGATFTENVNWFKHTPIVNGSELFEIANDGTITYKGTDSYGKVVVKQLMSVDYCKNGVVYQCGYPWGVGESVVGTNISSTNNTVGKLQRITDIRNVVDEQDLANVGCAITDTSYYENADWADDYYGIYLHGGTAYLHAQRYSSGGSYIWSGTQNSGSACIPTSKTVSVNIYLYDELGALVNSAATSYTFTPTSVG